MFFALMIIVSIVTSLVFILNKTGKDNALFRIVGGLCLLFSWVLIVMWFTVLIESWQFALNTPMANNDLVPAWGRMLQSLLHRVVFLFPITRLTLGILYALPIVSIPVLLIAAQPTQLTAIAAFSAVINMLFFWVSFLWMLVTAAQGFSFTFEKVLSEGIVFLPAYAFLLYGLVRQRPFATRPSAQIS